MKKFVASLGALSLVSLGLLNSGSALAAQADQDQDMTSLKARVAEMEATLAGMSQQAGRPAQADSAWSKYIRLSGGVNVDAKLVGSLGDNNEQELGGTDASTAGRFTGENTKRLGVNDAYVNVDADVNEWFSGRIGVTYNAVSEFYNPMNNETDTNAVTGDGDLRINQAYITMANFDKQPYYLRAGLQYVDFGSYQTNPIHKSMTQVLTQIDDVALQVGMLDASGFNVSVFTLETPFTKVDETTGDIRNRNQLNYGGSVGYNGATNGGMKYQAKVGYLSNMVGLDAFNRYAESNEGNNAGTDEFSYTDTVSEAYIGAGVESGAFAVGASYVKALRAFNNNDGVFYQTDSSAKPGAADVTASYSFKYWEDRNNMIGVGYERSWEASFMGLPKSRYFVDYTVGLYKNTDVTSEWSHDNDYSTNYLQSEGNPASGRNYNVVSARLAVNFG